MENRYFLPTNAQAETGMWTIYADDQGTIVGQYDDPNEVRDHLCQLGLNEIAMDVDGNGSVCLVPVEWIGDGKQIECSDRALRLIDG